LSLPVATVYFLSLQHISCGNSILFASTAHFLSQLQIFRLHFPVSTTWFFLATPISDLRISRTFLHVSHAEFSRTLWHSGTNMCQQPSNFEKTTTFEFSKQLFPFIFFYFKMHKYQRHFRYRMNCNLLQNMSKTF
jgi:hypothetical protein